MKRWFVLVAVVAGLLGVWVGVRFGQDASMEAKILRGLAILMGGNLLLGVWVWYRAKPGSGDAMVAPNLMSLPALMLVGVLPRLLWPGPDDEAIRMAGSIVSTVGVVSLVTWQWRHRSLRRSV